VSDANVLDEALVLGAQLAGSRTRAFGKLTRRSAQAVRGFESQTVFEAKRIAAQAARAGGEEGVSAFLKNRQAVFP